MPRHHAATATSVVRSKDQKRHTPIAITTLGIPKGRTNPGAASRPTPRVIVLAVRKSHKPHSAGTARIASIRAGRGTSRTNGVAAGAKDSPATYKPLLTATARARRRANGVTR